MSYELRITNHHHYSPLLSLLDLLRPFRGERPPHAHPSRLHDGNTASKLIETRIPDKLQDKAVHRQRSHASRSKQHDSGVIAGRIFANVGKLDVEGEQHPLFASRGSTDLHVGFPQQTFFGDSLNIVAMLQKLGLQMPRQILVELDSRQAEIFQTFSRASSAA